MFYKETTTSATSNSIMNEFPLNSPTTSLLMTPNTVKSIEQSILASLEVQTSNPQIIASAATGSFVPPLPSQPVQHTIVNPGPQLILANNWGGASVQNFNQDNTTTEEEDEDESMTTEDDRPGPGQRTAMANNNNNSKKPRKAVKKSGRRPRFHGNGEEDERRIIRRERNKLAAARCRKRRVDQTNMLLEETESLESRRSNLQSEIQVYQHKKEELEFVLQSHLPMCSFNTEKKYVPPVTMVTSSTATLTTPSPTKDGPKRPTSLLVRNNTATNNLPTNSTPSNGLTFDNIDWGLSGLTPGMTPVGGGAGNVLSTPLITPSTVRDILSGLGGGTTPSDGASRFVSL